MKPTAATTRRRFFFTAGAALSAPLAVAAAQPLDGNAEDIDALKARLARLEDVSAIRELNLAYAKHMNSRSFEEAAQLFAAPADAPFDGRIRSVSLDESGEQDFIEISDDRRRARARIHCAVALEAPIEPRCPLVDMALQQGGGVTKRFDRGVFENVYVKQDDGWKISRSAYVSAETRARG